MARRGEVNKDRGKVMEVGRELVALRLLWDFMVYTFFEAGLECTDWRHGGRTEWSGVGG